MVRGSRLESYGGSRLEARVLRWFEARGSSLMVIRGSRLEGYSDSRLLQFKAQGFVSSRLEVEDSRLLTVLFKA